MAKPPDLDENGQPVKPPDLDENHQPVVEAKQPTDVNLSISKAADEPVEDRKLTPEEENSLSEAMKRIWHQQTTPLVNLSPETEKAISGYGETNPILSKIAGVANSGIKTLLGLTTPLDLETAGLGGAETVAAKLGFPAIAKIAEMGTRALSAPVVAHGAFNLLSRDSTIPERLSGLGEIAGGGSGMLHGNRIPEASPEEIPTSGNNKIPAPSEIPQVTNKPNLRLQQDGSLIDKSTGEVVYQPKTAKGPNYYQTPVSGLNMDERYQARKNTALERFPDEVNNQLDPLAEQFRNAGGPGRERGDAARQMIGIRKFMEGEGIKGVGGAEKDFTKKPPDIEPEPEHLGDVIDKRRSPIKEALMLPKGIMASYDLSAPGRQGLNLIANKEWWTSWGSMLKSASSEDAFRSVQNAIAERPLFKDYGKGSFAEKVGLHLSDLTNLSNREEQIMSSWAEKLPGVRASNRAYTAYLNQLRADTFERMINNAKILGTDGEYNMPAAKTIASFVNNATGRGSLGPLEKYATELNTIFFSPRMIASRIGVLNPKYYWAAPPGVRQQAIKSLFAIAGTGTLIGQMVKHSGIGTVSSDPTNSDFGKIKVGDTRIDPFGGFQQYIVAANRLLQNKTTSSVSGKTQELGKKFGSPTREDIIKNFAESKLNPAISLATDILKGKDISGKPLDIPEAVAQRFIPLFLQDLKTVATQNPKLIPGYSDLGLENTDPARAMLAVPGAFGAGVQNYPSKR